MLRDYGEELKKASKGNKCVITVERPSPTLQPRFERLHVCLDG